MRSQVAVALSALLAGAIFGIGLAVAQMTSPAKVLSFLNVLGEWDPSLLLVMGAAVGVTMLGYRLSRGTAPLFGPRFHLPTATELDLKLLAGAVLFGVGWGIAGYCPGPALAGVVTLKPHVFVFILAMVIGGQLPSLVQRLKR